MLTSRPYVLDDEVDFVHNYYERLVMQEVHDQSARVQQGDRDFLADVACVALNRMPPRYIRYDVDMTFFMSPQDIAEIAHKVTQAVAAALSYVESRERGESATLPPVEVSLISTRGDKPPKTTTATAVNASNQATTDDIKSIKASAKSKSKKK